MTYTNQKILNSLIVLLLATTMILPANAIIFNHFYVSITAGGGGGGGVGDPDSVYGASAANVSGNIIGGGDPTYTRIVTSGSYTVATANQLVAALAIATPGQVVYVTPGATIDLTGHLPVGIPQGVTLASNRGSGWSTGATLVKSTWTSSYGGGLDTNGWTSSPSNEPMLYVMGNNVRVTGLTLRGEMTAQDGQSGDDSRMLVGVFVRSYSGLEVDNNEIVGWSQAGVLNKGAPDVYVHNCYIHNNQARGEGYGVAVFGGNMTAERNVFDWNRHDISGEGMQNEMYTFRYNIIIGHGTAIGGCDVDVHENGNFYNDGLAIAGKEYHIYGNTRLNYDTTDQKPFVHIRDIPTTGAYITRNDIRAYWGPFGTTDYGGVQSVLWESCQWSDHSDHVYPTNNSWHGDIFAGSSGILWDQGQVS